jgi:kinesin family protein 20
VKHVECEHPKFIRVSIFSFCDLAGAERAKHTQNVGETLRESQNINTSLHVLGRCLMTIRDNHICRGKKLILFRDSKLTRLFQRALNGKECLVMIVNVNPTSLLREETFNVLMFLAIAKQIILLPARHQKRVPRSSRFSQYISKSSTLISNGTCEGDISTSPLTSSRDNQHLHNQIETIVNKVGELVANCKSSLKNAEKLKEAAQAACEGGRHVLIKELESQLAAMREEFCKKEKAKIQELDGILEDAQIDCKQLEDDLKATEKERDYLDLKLVEKESELGHSLDALSDKQRILDKQLFNLDEKDECIEILEKKLKELQEKYDIDLKTMTRKSEELEEKLKTSLMNNKLMKSDMADILKKQEENNSENVRTLQSEVKELKKN